MLSTSLTPAPGKIGEDGKYIYSSSPRDIPDPTWDGTEMELTDDPSNPGGNDPTDPVAPCLTNTDERAVFFTKSSDFGNTINCYIWYKKNGNTTQVCGGWPGKKATALGNDTYKFVVPAEAAQIDNTWMIIWNDGSGNQTADLHYLNHYLYTGASKGSIQATEQITAICEATDIKPVDHLPPTRKILINGMLYIVLPDGEIYNTQGQMVNLCL